MTAPDSNREGTRSDLSVCVDQLQALLATVQRQEAHLCDHASPYFDETIVLAHAHLDGAIRALRGILDRLNETEK
jgi:hypothetical protein